jgi:SP family general alpha glucoside:H+ symporter-like MFS transporter
MAHNWAGNLIAKQAVYFFEREPEPYTLCCSGSGDSDNLVTEAGISTYFAFALGLISSALQVVGVCISWVASAYFGRRTLYLAGTITNALFALILGIVPSVGHSTGGSYAQAVFGILISFMLE